MTTPFCKAINYFGNQKRLADAIGVSRGYINHIATGRRKISPKICVVIEKETKGMILRSELRPDLFK